MTPGTAQPRGEPGGDPTGAEDPWRETRGPGGRALREREDAAVQGARDHDEAAAGAATPGQRDDPNTQKEKKFQKTIAQERILQLDLKHDQWPVR